MPIDVRPPRIDSKESPREIIASDFKSLGEIPIHGGWGYSFDDAVVIDKNDSIVSKDIPFDGVGLEYVFVEKRIYEELIIFPSKDDKYSGIKWDLIDQKLVSRNGKTYDVLRFYVTALPDSDFEELKAEWEGPNGYGSPSFDIQKHEMERDKRTIRYVGEFYFDITSFFGQE